MLQRHVYQQLTLLPQKAGMRERLLRRGYCVRQPGDRDVSVVSAGHGIVRVFARHAGLLPNGDGVLQQRTVLRGTERPVLRLRAGSRVRTDVPPVTSSRPPHGSGGGQIQSPAMLR